MPIRYLLNCLAISLLAVACGENKMPPAGIPEVLDDRIHIELITESPEIVTPIGLAIDAQDNLYILESHTHSPLSDYAGPTFDRIKKGVDQDKDGIPESWIIFADSITDGMNLVCDENNTLYLAEKNRVLSFSDTDGDGSSDERRVLLDMPDPDNVYDHAGILGLALSGEGWLYVSRGNTGGQSWRINGTDGTFVSGYGDGGNVIRCRLDGSRVEEVATGFWNPFALTVTSNGRLMLTDNDPDSRGPNRLIDIVYGGDYGYESLYGGSGIHPFLAWHGELPGTLPYAAALGEAPTGLIDANQTQVGESYPDNILAAIWEENRIVRIPLTATGSTVSGTSEVLIQGDSTFHPVAMATNSKGEVYLTDWVVRQYPNHGSGKIWRIRNKEPKPFSAPGVPETLALLPDENPFPNAADLVRQLRSADRFTQTLARQYATDATIDQLLADVDAQLRLQGLLAMTEGRERLAKAQLQTLLRDDSESVRRVALLYIAKNSRSDLYPNVNEALFAGDITPALFETFLATIRHLQPDFIEGYRLQSENSSKKLPRNLPADYVISLIRNEHLDSAIRAAAFPYLEDPAAYQEELIQLARNSAAPVQSAFLQVFRRIPNEGAAEAMFDMVTNEAASPALRAEAIVSLGYQSRRFCEEMPDILQAQSATLVETAARYLCGCENRDSFAGMVAGHPSEQTILDSWELCEGATDKDRPGSDAAWAEVITGSGNAENGKWIFQSLGTQCQTCHQVAGWGGHFGPDLSHVGSSKSKTQLLTAILQPSKEISPEWQGWFVKTKAGETYFGRQIDVGLHNVELMLSDGTFETYKEPQDYGLAPASLMPEGLENILTPSELNDLITYLISLK